MDFHHIPVLFEETISSLNIKPDGVYVDCTGGGGGHSKAIADKLNENGRLITIDQDPEAIAHLKEKFASYNNVIIIKDNFSNIDNILSSLGIASADGIMADLGISSHQIDTAERGFSVHNEAPLDMRMSKEGLSAADIVNTYSEKELIRIFSKYGEEKFSKSIARHIVANRDKKRIESTTELAEIVKNAIPARARREGGHPARRIFQAVRIEANSEIELLPEAVRKMFSLLKKDGILSIITFHSLEDRIVKNEFKSFCEGCVCPKDFPVCVCGKTPDGEFLFKSVAPSDEEIERNPRSRSARLRSIRKLK